MQRHPSTVARCTSTVGMCRQQSVHQGIGSLALDRFPLDSIFYVRNIGSCGSWSRGTLRFPNGIPQQHTSGICK